MSLEKAEAAFNLKPGKELQPEVLRKAVTDAGFTPREISITATGKFIEREGKFMFQPLGSSQVFSLVESSLLSKFNDKGQKQVVVEAKVVEEKGHFSFNIEKIR